MNKLTIISDIHGCLPVYFDIIKNCYASVQLGDHGFDYDHFSEISLNHRMFFGNHDNYDKFNFPHNLGDFGYRKITEDTPGFFFVRGANSIDRHIRTPGISWWANEELNWEEGNRCLSLYKKEKPAIVITHCCPGFVCDEMYRYSSRRFAPSFTEKLLDAMFEIHKPTLWVFGHHHQNWQHSIEGCGFICLDEFATLEI